MSQDELRTKARRWLDGKGMKLSKEQMDVAVRMLQQRDKARSMHAYGYGIDALGIDDCMTGFMTGIYMMRELRA